MSIIIIILVLVVFGGLLLMGVGGYFLYEFFSKDETESVWLGSRSTALIVGIIGIGLGLVMMCAPIAFMAFGVSMLPMR